VYVGSLAAGGWQLSPSTAVTPTVAIREVTRAGRVTLAIELPYGITTTLALVEWATERANGRLVVMRAMRGSTELVLELTAPVTLGLELRLHFSPRGASRYDEVCLRV